MKIGHMAIWPCALILSFNRRVISLHKFKIKIGNIVANVDSNHDYIGKICSPYFTDDQANCGIILDQTSIEAERKRAADLRREMGLLPAEADDWFLEVYVLLHKLLPFLPAHEMLFMHGSAISYNGKAYIFVAPSGTGKSTHRRLWKERFGEAVTVINDDKPFLTFVEDKVYLCGTPWRGKHAIGKNMTAELGGICILSQGKTNEIRQLKASEAVKQIIKQSNLAEYKENALLALDLIDRLLQTVPVYHLSCTPTLDAVDVCFHEMIK